MKMHHPHYANQKLQTQWGMIQCDENGQAVIHPEAQEFFEKTLKFKKGAPSKDDEVPLKKETRSDATSHEMPEDQDAFAAADSHESRELLGAEEEHEEVSDEEAPAEEGVAKSRFSKKAGHKKAGHKK